MFTASFTLVHLLVAAQQALSQHGFVAGSFSLTHDPNYADKGVVCISGSPTSGLDSIGRSILLEFTWHADVPQFGFWRIDLKFKGSRNEPLNRKAACAAHESNLPFEIQKIVAEVLKG